MEREKLAVQMQNIETDIKYVFISDENRLVSLHRICMQQQKIIQALFEKVYPSPEACRPSYSVPITLDECNLSVGTINSLQNKGLKTLEDVYVYFKEYGDRGLLKIKCFGHRSLKEIKLRFQQYGYTH